MGCGDASSDPLAVMVAAETHGALAVAEELPALPDLTAQTLPEGVSDAALEQWKRSWELGEEGEALRMDAYVATVPRLAPALGVRGVGAVLAPVVATVAAGEAMEAAQLPGFVVDGTRRGRTLVDEADRALAAGDVGRALLLTLEAADVLRALGPQEVARDLVSRAEEALGRIDPARPYSRLELERSRHLVTSAEAALDRNDYLRAIRRAFYACQLLGVELR